MGSSTNPVQTISKLILQLWLLGLFLHFFGLPALKRFHDKKVIVVTSVENTDGIPAPAITITVIGAKNGNGWKTQGAIRKFVTKHCKKAKSTNAIIQCIKRQTYNLSEISSGIKMGLGPSVVGPHFE